MDIIFISAKLARSILSIPRERVNQDEKWIKHVSCDGARFHVLSYSGYLGKDGKTHARIRCSEPDCIYNKPDSEKK